MIPKDGLGGVEQAARSLNPDKALEIETVFVCGKTLSDREHIKVIDENIGLNSFCFYFRALQYLIKNKPDLLICSLWRVSFVGVFYYLYTMLFYREKVNLVIFIHANKYAHLIDKLVTKTAVFLATEVWCDSEASRKAIFPKNRGGRKVKIISFFIKNEGQNIVPYYDRENNFVFWGRIAKQKRLDRAIRLFNEVLKESAESFFYIYGPDSGDLGNVHELVDELNLKDKVMFMGPKKPNHYPELLRNAKFFINTSTHEGMAIAVVEAMQLGLIPVVTPVGEVGNYCTDGVNSIYYNECSKSKIIEILNDNELCESLSRNAVKFWLDHPSYTESFNENCLRLISKGTR